MLNLISPIYLFCSFIILSCSFVYAGPNCEQEAYELAKSWGVKDLRSIEVGEQIFSKRDTIWIWLNVARSKSGYRVSRLSQFERIQVSFSGSLCVRNMSVKQIDRNPLKNKITDDVLKEIILDKTGIVYLWSPHMPLSIRGIPEIQKVAKSLKLNLTILKGSSSSLKKYPDFFQKNWLRELDSFGLDMRGSSTHYPALFFYKDGKFLDDIKYGYERGKRFEFEIKKIFSM